MNDIFTPSLILSLGPSAKKALTLSGKFLSCLPNYFRNVIKAYDIQDESKAKEDIQDIIDNNLLCARYLNILVDMGFKVRTQNTSTVRLNIYLLWDVYNSDISGYDMVKLITKLNFGNLDTELHTGVTLLVIPMLDKEWKLDDKTAGEAVTQLKNTLEHITNQEIMLSIDSKMYMLHMVSNDGSRIRMDELQYVCSLLIYLSVVPSEDPPLLHYNRRLLKEELRYKIGSIGIASMTLLTDKLTEDYSKMLAADILRYGLKDHSEEKLLMHKSFEGLSYENQKNKLMELSSNNKENYDVQYYSEIVESINCDLNETILNTGLNSAKKYLKEMKNILVCQKIASDQHIKYNICDENNINMNDKEKEIIKKYNEQVTISNNVIFENNKKVINYLDNELEEIEAYIQNVSSTAENLSNIREEELSGGLVTSLLDLIDRKSFYEKQNQDLPFLYSEFIKALKDISRLKDKKLESIITAYAGMQALQFDEMDILTLLQAVYGNNIEKEVSKWIKSGLVKSQYLLQYTCSEALEEHSIFLACPQLSQMVRNIIAKEFGNLHLSVIDSINNYINCISIIRLCFGIDFNKISPIKRLNKRSL